MSELSNELKSDSELQFDFNICVDGKKETEHQLLAMKTPDLQFYTIFDKEINIDRIHWGTDAAVSCLSRHV